MRIRFTDFVFDTEARQLERHGVPVHLSPKAFTILEVLVERRPKAVSKRELLDRVWPDAVVEERNVKNVVAEIRSALHDDSDDPGLVRTVQRFGYAFSAEVQLEEPRSPERESGTRTVSLPVVIGALVLVSAGIGLWTLSTRRSLMPRTSAPFERMRMARVSTAGNVSAAAISPDGKLLAYGTEDGVGSLWLGQTSSESRTRLASFTDLVVFADDICGGITFSPDGNSIYYTAWMRGELSSILFRIPTIGGAATTMLRDVDSAIAFSPDGSRFAFTRGYPQKHKTTLVVANADGSGEHTIATRTGGEFTHASWSPDGRIATVFNDGLGRSSVESFDLRSGRSAVVGPMRWSRIGRIAWLSDGRSLLLSAEEPGQERTKQLWLISYPEGIARKITHDLNDYRSLTMTTDSKLLVVQTAQNGQVWISSATGASPRQLTLNRETGLDGLSWTEGGDILYTTAAGNRPDIWRINPRSGASVPVIEHPGFDGTPIECGEFLVFTSNRSGVSGVLWRADRDGNNTLRLTAGTTYGEPVCSADGQWVFYRGLEGKSVLTPWKVSIRGAATQIVSHDAAIGHALALSPDGKSLAFMSVALSADSQPLGKTFLEIIDADRGLLVTKLELPSGFLPSVPLQWTPDGKALAYVDARDGASNIWRLPLDGTPATPITHFDSGQRLLRFAFSGDGKQLALVRGWKTSDVVLIDQ